MRALLAGVTLWFAVHWAFVAVMHAKQAKDRMTVYWQIMLLPLGVICFALDVAFNLTFGSLMYRELPREWLFTHRCRRHLRGEGGRQRLAAWWQKQLDLFDPGHVA